MTDELQTQNYPREQYATQAPIGAAPASLAASIALGRLLRSWPYADLESIRFEIHQTAAWSADHAAPGPYVVCRATEPGECPSCHTIAGQHPHTEYCRRTAELQHRADLEQQPLGQTSQPATRTSQPRTERRAGVSSHVPVYATDRWPAHLISECSPSLCGEPSPFDEPTPLATPTPHHGCTHTCDYPACQMQGHDCTGT